MSKPSTVFWGAWFWRLTSLIFWSFLFPPLSVLWCLYPWEGLHLIYCMYCRDRCWGKGGSCVYSFSQDSFRGEFRLQSNLHLAPLRWRPPTESCRAAVPTWPKGNDHCFITDEPIWTSIWIQECLALGWFSSTYTAAAQGWEFWTETGR